MRQVLCISSGVTYGTVGLAASVPALQAAGFTCLQLPTILLSNHPGLGKPAGVRLPANEIAAMLAVLESQGVLAKVEAVFTGYFASADQVETVARLIGHMRQRNPGLFVLVDPVLGDADRLYVAEEIAVALRNLLLPQATCTTPNRFELSWLSGRNVSTLGEAVLAARSLPCGETLATSVPGDHDKLLTLAVMPEDHAVHRAMLRQKVPHGTGDFLAGLYLAARLNGLAPANALQLSSALLDQAIDRSANKTTLDVIGTLGGT